ncbi:MAG: glycosyltransferase [Sedimentisphaerales bacterium]|nr:glycosyltransferase [Sedimentisphaerales bacterium]
MEWYDYIAWAALVAQALFLYHAVRNYRYALAKLRKEHHLLYRPKAALIVPCRGLEAQFHSNIRSFFQQDYNNYRLFFVVGDTSDPAYAELDRIANALRRESQALDVQILVAGASTSSSQKIHNLLHAIQRVPTDTEVLAFADSDICVDRDWLSRLVWPLRRSKCGLATGYRWFVPTRNNLASLVLSAVNASVAQLLGNSRFNQAWGGSMAVRAEDFRRLNLRQTWKGTLSDDLSLSRAVRKAGMKVTFVPGCLVASLEAMSWSAFYEFARRQFLITRVYTPATWWLGFLSSLGSVAGLWGGAAVALWAARDQEMPWLYAAVPVIFLAGQLLRAVLRQRMAVKILSAYRRQLVPTAWADILGSWLWSLLLLFVLLSSAFGRTIRWRGIRYRLDSPHKTTILTEP